MGSNKKTSVVMEKKGMDAMKGNKTMANSSVLEGGTGSQVYISYTHTLTHTRNLKLTDIRTSKR